MAVLNCTVEIGPQGRELKQHGSALFPVACYHDFLPQEEVPWHWHDELELVLVERGTAAVGAGGCEYLIGEGAACFINAGVLHQVLDAGTGDCRLHSVLFHPRLVGGSADSIFWQRYLQPMLCDPALGCVRFDRDVPWNRQIRGYIRRAWELCAREPSGYEFQVRALLSRVIFLLTDHCPSEKAPPAAKALREDQRIKAMLRYVQEHCAEELTVADIARAAAVSESECLRCFRSRIGSTPIRYVRQYRVQRAAELLSGTDLKISEIGALCGFQEMSYFARTFREVKGCTPGEYRQRALAGQSGGPHGG